MTHDAAFLQAAGDLAHELGADLQRQLQLEDMAGVWQRYWQPERRWEKRHDEWTWWEQNGCKRVTGAPKMSGDEFYAMLERVCRVRLPPEPERGWQPKEVWMERQRERNAEYWLQKLALKAARTVHEHRPWSHQGLWRRYHQALHPEVLATPPMPAGQREEAM